MSDYDEDPEVQDVPEDDENDDTVQSTRTKTAVKPDGPQWHKVVLTHPNHNNRIAFRSVSERRARQFLENRYPRGSEAHLVMPDGSTHHYEAERQGEHGQDADKWAPFDPSEWLPVDQNPPPGDSEWADKEG